MKLCIVTHKVSKGDGQGRVNYEVAWEAIRRGYRIILVATEVAPDLLEQDLVEHIPIVVDGFPTALLKEMIFSYKSTKWLGQNRDKFDLVKVNGAITSFESDLNALHFVHSAWLNSPYHTFKVHRDLYGLYQFFYTALNSYWEKRACDRTKLIIAVSENVKQDLLKLNLPADKIKVIPNGVDLQEFNPEIKCDRTKLRLPEKSNLALFIGDIKTPRKNLETVLQALTRVPSLELVVVGSTKDSPYVKMTEQLGLKKRVHFLGYRQDIDNIMKACDLFVFPSRYETFGLVILEAMATGLPIITAKTTGAAQLVTPEVGIVLDNPDDVDSLVKGLNKLNNDSSLRQKMGKIARMIAEQYSWQNVAMSYLDLWEKVNYSNYYAHEIQNDPPKSPLKRGT